MARLKKPNEIVRLNLDVGVECRRTLNDLQKRTESMSITDVVKKAVKLYDFLLFLQEQGGKLKTTQPDGQDEIIKIL